MRGLNSANEVFFFSQKPEEYELPRWNYAYEISKATEQAMDSAKAKTRDGARFQKIQFGEPIVDVQGKKYIYIVRSTASRDHFRQVMSPDYLRNARGVGIRGLHYAAVEAYGDAIGLTVEADTPQAAKQQFRTWYAKINEALKALEGRFVVLNKHLDQKIEELACQRLEELNRAKNAL